MESYINDWLNLLLGGSTLSQELHGLAHLFTLIGSTIMSAHPKRKDGIQGELFAIHGRQLLSSS